MHYLHKILVHIPRDMPDLGFTREELISMAKMSGEAVIMKYDPDILERGYTYCYGTCKNCALHSHNHSLTHTIRANLKDYKNWTPHSCEVQFFLLF